MKTTFIALIPVYSIFSILMLFMAVITDTNYGVSSVQEACRVYRSLCRICQPFVVLFIL